MLLVVVAYNKISLFCFNFLIYTSEDLMVLRGWYCVGGPVWVLCGSCVGGTVWVVLCGLFIFYISNEIVLPLDKLLRLRVLFGILASCISFKLEIEIMESSIPPDSFIVDS